MCFNYSKIFNEKNCFFLSMTNKVIIIVFLSFNAAGKKCVVYDAVFHPDTYSKGQEVWMISMKREKICHSTWHVSFLDFEGGKFYEMSASNNNLLSDE